MKYLIWMAATAIIAFTSVQHGVVKQPKTEKIVRVEDSIQLSYALFNSKLQQSKKEINFKLTQLAVYNRRIDSVLRVRKCRHN